VAEKLRPFDYKKDTPKDVGLGGPSTEYLITLDSPDGGVWVIPSIWWDKKGKPTLLDPKVEGNQKKAFDLAKQYEKDTGKKFPRYDKGAYGQADNFAIKRSHEGGASSSYLAAPKNKSLLTEKAPEVEVKKPTLFDMLK